MNMNILSNSINYFSPEFTDMCSYTKYAVHRNLLEIMI